MKTRTVDDEKKLHAGYYDDNGNMTNRGYHVICFFMFLSVPLAITAFSFAFDGKNAIGYSILWIIATYTTARNIRRKLDENNKMGIRRK